MAANEHDDASTASESIAARVEARHKRDFPPAAVDALTRARRNAHMDRDRAAGDRGFAAGDRSDAKADRVAAAADREVAADERESAHIDELTGTLRRGAGFSALDREIARAQRSGQRLVLAFGDVVGLKTINDSFGHVRGDQVLREVANTLRGHLRDYDPIVRYGGDEFVFAIAGLTLKEASDRAAGMCATLVEGGVSLTIGLAEWHGDDSLESLVDRADADLRKRRGSDTSRSCHGVVEP